MEHNHAKNSGRYFIYLLLVFLILLNLLPVLAPVLMHFGFKTPAKAIYFVYSFMCHQKAHRSAFIFDEQCAWCVRDTFIWMAMLVVLLFVLKTKRVSGLSWKIALIFALPMALDGSIQLIGTINSLFTKAQPFYESTNTIRAITGTLFGTAVGMFMFPRLKNEVYSEEISERE